VFWSVAGVEVLIIAAIDHWWAWFNLLTLLLLVHLLNASKRDLQRIFATFLDGRAKELGMTGLDPAKMK
jgi:hypothetical protein